MIILIIILILELYLLHKILKYFLLSPIYLYVIFSLISIIFTVWYFYFFEDKFSLFGLDNVSESSFLQTIKWYIIALMSFLGGVITYYDFSLKKTKKAFNKSFAHSLFFSYKIPSLVKKIAVIIFFIILILYLITYGKGIFIREEYLPKTNRALTIIIKILSFIEVVILGVVYRENKLLSSLYFFLLILISIGTGSRSVFLFFLVYISLVFISNGNTILNKIRFSIHLILSFVFLAYLIELRQLELHGVIPYLKSLAYMSSFDFYRSLLFNVYYTFIYGFFVTIKTIKESQLDWNIIFINLNPLPGSMAGWYNYAQDMRINIYVPYTLHGRVFRTGMGFTIVYFFITGLIFTYFEKKIRNLLSSKNKMLAFVLVIILTLHIVYAFEYNMRSAIRYFYYAFFIVGVVYLFKQIVANLPKREREV